MRMNRFGDAGLPRRLPASLENAIGSDGAARVPAWEEPVGGPLPTPVRGENLPERLRQHDLPVFVAFAVANPDHAAFAIQIGYLQVGHFRYAEPCAVHRGQNRAMSEVLRRFEQRFDFGLAENGRQFLLIAGQWDSIDLDSSV